MSLLSLDRLFGLAGVGSTIVNAAILKRFIAGVILVIALTAISSTLAGVLVAGGFYGLYLSLMYFGLNHQAAVITVTSLAVFITVGLGVWAKIRWQQLGDLPHMLFPDKPIISHASKLAGAFVDGFLERHQ